jgi:hypothetical protein
MAVGIASLALSRFAGPRSSFWFVLYLDKTGDKRVSHEKKYYKRPLKQAAST